MLKDEKSGLSSKERKILEIAVKGDDILVFRMGLQKRENPC